MHTSKTRNPMKLSNKMRMKSGNTPLKMQDRKRGKRGGGKRGAKRY